jgi:hypothetical protein
MMLQVNNFLYNLGAVQSVDKRFLSGLPAGWQLGKYVTLDKMIYNL